MAQRKLLLVGDVAAPTGFARVNEHLLRGLRDTWDIHVLGINYTGDSTPLQREYHMYPASMRGSDMLGIERIRACVEWVKPDLIVLHQDAWNVGAYLTHLEELDLPPILGYCPPDAPNQHYGNRLNALTHLLCPTQFGVDELVKGGYTGTAEVLPYGVDQALYRPMDFYAARDALGLPADAFILGRADRNAPRKRHDLMLSIFAEWVRTRGRDDAFLHLHCAPRDQGWDLPQLVHALGLQKRVFFTADDLHPAKLSDEALLPHIYSAWDVHWSTTLGEGFGLTALESAACGTPQLLPDYSAYGEWMKDAAYLVPCTSVQVHTGGINSIGGVVDRAASLAALDVLWGEDREGWQDKALDLGQSPRYSWSTIVPQFAAIVERVYETRRA